MLVSHRKEFIYSKTVKTAGTSVESYFEKYCMPEGEWEFSHSRKEYVGASGIIGYRGTNPIGKKFYNHMPAKDIRDKLGDQTWERYFKFCVVRDPFDKLVSGFHMFEKRKAQYTLKEKLALPAVRWITKGNPIDRVTGDTPVERFRSWIKKGGWVDDRDKYMIDGNVCMDTFILYEDLQGGIRKICEHLEIAYEPENIPHLKAGNREGDVPLSEYYDSETIAIVSRLYEFELKAFGYKAP